MPASLIQKQPPAETTVPVTAASRAQVGAVAAIREGVRGPAPVVLAGCARKRARQPGPARWSVVPSASSFRPVRGASLAAPDRALRSVSPVRAPGECRVDEKMPLAAAAPTLTPSPSPVQIAVSRKALTAASQDAIRESRSDLPEQPPAAILGFPRPGSSVHEREAVLPRPTADVLTHAPRSAPVGAHRNLDAPDGNPLLGFHRGLSCCSARGESPAAPVRVIPGRRVGEPLPCGRRATGAAGGCAARLTPSQAPVQIALVHKVLAAVSPGVIRESQPRLPALQAKPPGGVCGGAFPSRAGAAAYEVRRGLSPACDRATSRVNGNVLPPVFNLPKVEDATLRMRGIPRARNFSPRVRNFGRG